ncbi:MAG: copper homeostasis protein CutC [Marmoricola sp.]
MTPDQVDGPGYGAGESAELDVVVLHARDAEAAAKGGADRLLLSADPEDGHWSPEPAMVSAVLKESDVPVWVVLRTRAQHFAREVVLGQTFIELGARGVAYGFLDRDLEIDRASCAEMCSELGGVPWLFHGFDVALDADHAWRDVIGLPGLESVISAGSTRGLAHGAEELIARATRDPRVAELVTAGSGLTPDQVPWLARAGVRRFAIGSSARVGGSWTRGSVDVDRIRSWRMLVDDALSRALGIPVED